MDKITIIIPVYNIAPYLRRCLDSVLQQTYELLEVIVINDGSTDNSLSILEEYALGDERIKIIDKNNGGVTSCRKIGVEQADGGYVFFLDGDDWLEKETIERLYWVAKKQDADVVVGDIQRRVKAKFFPYVVDDFETLSSKEYIYQLARGKQLWCLCMKLIKTSICKRMVVPDGLSMAEDMTGMLQIAYYAKCIAKCNYYGYNYYQREGASTKTPTRKHAEDVLLAAEYVTGFLSKNNKDYTKAIAWINLRCLLTSCNQGGLSRKDSRIVNIYKEYFKTEYLAIFPWFQRLILWGFCYGVNLYQLLFLLRKFQRIHINK